MRKIFILLYLLISNIAFSQEGGIPKLLIKNDSLQSLKLDQLSIAVDVVENLATTTMTMRFYNNTNRRLEGEFNFPLGEGQNISRFAMDINGKMREGVVVEKAKGTEVFESIVYKKVDPGLLEMTEGNNFKSRVYPINPKGYKTIIIAFEHDLNIVENQYLYLLPLHFKEIIKDFDVKVEVLESEYEPSSLHNELVTLHFDKVNKVYKSAFSQSNFKANGQLGFSIPIQDNKVELPCYKGTIDPVSYFYKTAVISNEIKHKEKPEKITIYWDNSGSALNRDFTKETTILNDYFSWARNVKVELLTFANELDKSITFNIKDGNWKSLKVYLAKLKPDGGTQLGKLNFNNAKFNEIILFSDGLSNYGKNQIQLSSKRVSVINSSRIANHSYLKYIAQSTGGQYINLNNTTINNAFEALTTEKLQLLKAEYNKDEISDIFINNKTEDLNRFTLVGKINTKSAVIILHFGYPNQKTLYTQKITIDNRKPKLNNLLERYWVQQKLNFLNVNFQDNKEEITSLGKKFGMVTKTTSLIVLDEIADYVTYKITPPIELQEEYYALLAKKKKAEKLSLEERLDDVNNLYKKKVDWWKTDWEKVAKEKKEKARIDSIQRIERARLDRIKARNKFIVDSTAKAEQELLYNKDKAIADSVIMLEKIKNDSLLAIRNASPIKEISGIILSAEDNLPLPGATILVKGTNYGTISDIEGRFSLGVPDKSIVSFKYMGYFAQQIDVSNLYNLAVTLKKDTSALQEIIIMGSRIESRNHTGAVTMVTAKNISNDRNQATRDNQTDNLHSTIELKEWNPEVPYLDSLKKVKLSDAYNKHLAMRTQYLENPSYFLDAANFFMSHNDKDNAIRVLSNLSEMQMQDHEILRVLARKLLEFGETDAAIEVFKQVLELRPFEPQSYRDLGLAYAENKEYQKAVETLYKVITTQWSESIAEKFEGIETIVIGEMNSIIVKAGNDLDVSFIDKRFLINLPVDIRVVLNWDADNTDMDLWVTDPENEKCFYSNSRTVIGGYISEDLTEGYGPEEFLLKNAIEGNYKIEVNYYSSSQQSISGPVTLQILLYTNFGKPNETMKRMTLRLSENKSVLHIGNLLFELSK